ncbi:hypothetical protein BH23CHL7_BH23CHL7_15920 [soil metagenome]
MSSMDDLHPAFRDLLTGGEDEEWQDFISPEERRLRYGHSATTGAARDQLEGESVDRELPLERLPAIEQSLGVELGCLYAVASDLGAGGQLQIQVNGEVSAVGGKQLDALVVVAVIYDRAGRVLGTGEHHYFEGFAGWDAFSILSYVSGHPVKVRVFLRGGS